MYLKTLTTLMSVLILICTSVSGQNLQEYNTSPLNEDIIFYDDFSSNDNNWKIIPYDMFDDLDEESVIKKGAYHINSYGENNIYRTTATNINTLQVFQAECEIINYSKKFAYNYLVCGFSKSGETGLFFGYNNNGDIKAYIKDKSGSKTLFVRNDNEIIDDFNKLTIRYNNGTCHFFFNEQLVGSASGISITDNEIGLKISAGAATETNMLKLSELILNNSHISSANNTQTKVAPVPTSVNRGTGVNLNEIVSSSDAKYYALLIAVEDYSNPNMIDLDNPVKDIKELQTVLNSKYKFDNIEVLTNPSRNDLFNVLDDYANKVKEGDNFLLFYSGHGLWDAKMKKGYWLLSDADKDKRSTWFSNSDLRDYLSAIKCKHTLLISDACFSGSIFKTRGIESASSDIKKLYDMNSKKAMTSGTMNVVPDNSTFTKSLIRGLNYENKPYLTANYLFSEYIHQTVLDNTGNVPQHGTIHGIGNQGGDFIFIKKE